MIFSAPTPTSERCGSSLRTGAPITGELFHEIRRRALVEGCKWDPQVRDTPTLASFPLFMAREEWNQLAALAERLTRDALAAEVEIVERQPHLLARLGLPRAVRRALRSRAALTPAAARVIRFDFHFTTEGWRISEANSDVPGGYSEGSFFAELMAEQFANVRPAGHPANALCDTLANSARDGVIALLAAPGYMEDLQIVSYLSRRLNARGCSTRLATPAELLWRDGRAGFVSGNRITELSAVFRFYQSEWLARLPVSCGWKNFFRGGITPVANPGLAVISESKRFPLVLDELTSPMDTWRALLPETRDPREAPWRTDDSWLLKTAMCNNGDTVSCLELMTDQQRKQVTREVRWFPGQWLAQKRFATLPIDTPLGLMFPCIGVYTVNGQACGAYTRLAHSPIVNFAATDAALLIED